MTAYQLFDPLPDVQYEALKADIAKRGVMVPVELDELGDILDGHHRVRACAELGLADYPTIVREGLDEHAKHEHVLKMNLLRRQLDELSWADAFGRLARLRGVELGRGARNDRTSATVADVAAEVGVPERTARHRLQVAKLLTGDPELAERVRANELSGSEAVRQRRQDAKRSRRAALADQIAGEPLPPAPSGPFRVLVADPPWRFEIRPEDDSQRGHVTYPTMTVEEIAAFAAGGIPVTDLACDDSVCWLWTTNVHLPVAFGVLGAWGFRYITTLTWAKHKMGVGDWLRGQTEHCLLGVRGKPAWLLTNQTTLLHAPVREHSQKPGEFYALVEALCPGSKLELFAREQRDGGWASWGAELAGEQS
jgi:N6-adenosine-specific RNA methylase IME4/ParB-like chromosome segregation protein Spo0J